jgi:choline dehydrogenase-like flavoprotein
MAMVGAARTVEFLVVGGGTCGAAIAGRLVEAGHHVLLVEAGPDYGTVDSGRWPERLLDPSIMPVDTHSWQYTNSGTNGPAAMEMQRARVIGGCSSHNGCAVVAGHRDDYDSWERAGNPGWGTDGLSPYFASAIERFRVYTPNRADVTPFQQAVLGAAADGSIPYIDDFTDFDITEGLGIGPINISDRLRWNAAFAYLDPVRDNGKLTILPDTLASKVIFEGTRAVALEVVAPDGVRRLRLAAPASTLRNRRSGGSLARRHPRLPRAPRRREESARPPGDSSSVHRYRRVDSSPRRLCRARRSAARGGNDRVDQVAAMRTAFRSAPLSDRTSQRER